MRSGPVAGLVVAFLVGMVACRQQQPAPPADPTPIAQRIGWFDSGCLFITNGALTAGTHATAMLLGESETIVDSRVGAIETSPEQCPPRRQDINTGPGTFTYRLTAVSGRPLDIGIAVIGSAVHVAGGVDITGDGKPEQFTRCTTSEGLAFNVWSDGAFKGTPLWMGYQYLGYDTEPDCPFK